MLIRTFTRSRLAAVALVLAGSTTLAGCMSATPYRPAVNASADGFSDQRLEDDRFQVSFKGNSLTSRETVERYLLFRAAEITAQHGFDYFVLVNKDTERRTETYRTPGFSSPSPWGYWNPYWRFHRPAFGWRSWNPYFDDPFWRDRDWDYRTVNQYEAFAEIVVGRGPKPIDNLRAFNAREVIDRVGPSVSLPPPR